MLVHWMMRLWLGLLALLPFTNHGAIAQDASFTLRYGVLAGLTGDPAVSGQGWNAAAKLGIETIADTLKSMGINSIKVELADSQDSQGSPQAGVEAAQKLVQIDHVNVIVGDFYSSVTSAVATSVAIPSRVLMFTGGTSPALTKLNTGAVAYIWQPVAADDIQGRVLAQIITDTLGRTARINVGARNDAYGANLSAVFRTAWTSQGGTIPKFVVYNHQQPLLDSEAQELMQGDPDGWLFVDFCQTFEKLALPMIRSGKWDPAKSFGSDTLNNCGTRGGRNYPGMRATQANASAGTSFPAFKDLFAQKATKGVTFQSFLAEAFDSVFIAFFAAIEARSADPIKIAEHIVSVTNDPGAPFTFRELEPAIRAAMAGQKIHFSGATGPLNFTQNGRVTALAYDIWQHKPDGTSTVVKTINFQP
jgi:ABC-type branched-subunit amino acid transport system substrate-binding protein